MPDQRVNPRQDYLDLLEQLEKWATFILANLFWVLLALPIITLPLGTAGLFAVMMRRVRGDQTEMMQVFWGAVRRHGQQAIFIMLFNIAICALIFINLMIFPLMPDADVLMIFSRSITLFAGLALLMVNLYLWTLLVSVSLSLQDLMRISIQLVFLYPMRTGGILLAALLPLMLSLLLPRAIFVLITFAVMAYIISYGTEPLIRRHFSEAMYQNS